MRCAFGPVLLVAATLLLVSPARAQEDDSAPLTQPDRSAADDGAQERARLHFQSGASYYEAGSYEDALREWTRAYQLSNRTELLYNLSLAHQGLNQLTEARDYLRRFLDEVEDIPNRANLELRIENLDRRIAAPASSGEPVADPHAENPSGPDPEASHGGASVTAPNRDEGGYVSPGAIGGFAGAGAGVLMFAIFGSLTVTEDGRLSDRCGTSPCPQGTADDLRTFALLSDIGLGVTVVSAAIGLFFLLTDTGPDQAQVAVLPWFGEDGAGVGAGGRF